MIKAKVVNIMLFIGLVVILLIPLQAQNVDLETHEETILLVINKGFGEGILDVIDQAFAADFVHHDSMNFIEDRESLKSYISALRSAMPDIKITLDMLIVEGDWASFHFVSIGTFENQLPFFPGVQPTGKSVELTTQATLKFNEDGQIMEQWYVIDNLTFLTQLGVLPTLENSTVEIFALGYKNNGWGEFRSSGLREITEYTCTVDLDCSTEMFPSGLSRSGVRSYEDEDVERVSIQFSLEQDYHNVVLYLAKAGSETLVVTIDSERTYYVANTMTGSSEGGRYGDYNLRLGSLEAGAHIIEMSVADDGKGNGSFGWDFISLFAN